MGQRLRELTMPAPALWGFLLLITLTTAAGAQDAPQMLGRAHPSPVWSVMARGPLQQPLAIDSVQRQIRPTHWKKGALIGGLAMGLGFAYLADGFCRSSDTIDDCGGALPAGFLLGGVLGGFIGALIGGQFPKDEGL
jgi:hypothetical protein